METIFLHPESTTTADESRQRTVTALNSILTKLGGGRFAATYLDDFAQYVFSGELPPGLVQLKNAGDETYLKVIRIVSKAQAEAIAEAVPEPPARSGWLHRLFSRRSFPLYRTERPRNVRTEAEAMEADTVVR